MLSACGAPAAPNIHTCLRLTVAPSPVRWLHQGCRHPETGIRTLHPTKPSEAPAGPTTTITAGFAALPSLTSNRTSTPPRAAAAA
ncbi:unspecified product [Trypanosoma cruzi Dm28c]|uniref:Unspecified product n=1 Tax=Trypanosoma cruzi Dm28c TaxID=1416333 RepID=V5AJH9_TRYCR|nr:unspecified product [Trypanosoma cruzi Dm28c]